jgi:hypothetical protein
LRERRRERERRRVKESKSRAEIFNPGPGIKKLGVGDFSVQWGAAMGAKKERRGKRAVKQESERIKKQGRDFQSRPRKRACQLARGEPQAPLGAPG